MDRTTALQTLGLSNSATPAEQLEAYAREKARLDRLVAQEPDADLADKIAQSRALLEAAWQALQAPAVAPAKASTVGARPKPPSSGKYWYIATAVLVLLTLLIWKGLDLHREKQQQLEETERVETEKELASANEEVPRLLAALAEKLTWCETQKEVAAKLKEEADEAAKKVPASPAELAWTAKRVELFEHFVVRARTLMGNFDLEREKQMAEQCLRHGDRQKVAALVEHLRRVKVPADSDVLEAYDAVYENPLIAFCQSDAALLKLLQDQNPEAAEKAVQSLRLATEKLASVRSPTLDQLRPAFVLAAVAPESEPALQQLQKSIPALAYLSNPDSKTWPLLNQLIEADRSGDFANVQKISSDIRSLGGVPRPAFLRTEALAIFATFDAASLTKHYPHKAWEQKLAAEDELATAARAGDDIAIRQLGVWLARWTERDDLPALPWLEKAAALGDEPSREAMLKAYLRREDPHAYAMLKAKLESSPENGVLILELARLTEKGVGVEANVADALKLFFRADSLGEQRAVPEIYRTIASETNSFGGPARAYEYAFEQLTKHQPSLTASTCESLLEIAPIETPDLAKKCFQLTLAAIDLHPEKSEDFGKYAVESVRAIAGQESAEDHQAADALYAQLEQRKISGAAEERAILQASHDCEKCNGSGRTPAREDCQDCGGNGKIGCARCDQTGVDTVFQKKCTRCNGTGYVNCASCNGRGWRRTREPCSSCGGSGHWNWLIRSGQIPEFKSPE